jgi:exopolysaccharide production protein ExoQ
MIRNRRARPAAQPNQPSPRLAAAARLWKKDTQGAGLIAAMLWMVIFIMIIPQGLDYAGLNGMPTSSDALSKFVWLFLLGGSAVAIAWKSQRATKLLKYVNPFLIGFLCIAFASYAWSIEPSITMRRVIRAATVIMVCYSFALVAWNQHRFQSLLRTILTPVMVASVVFVLLAPEMAIHQSDLPELKDAWRGITLGKNALGPLSSVCVILWAHGYLSKQVPAFKALMGVGVAAACLIGSRSATSLMTTVFGLVFLAIVIRAPKSYRRYMPYLIGLFAVVIVLYALAVLRIVPGSEILLSPIPMITGKDLTFTGRTAIWEILNKQIRLHPLLGSGYAAYWIGATPESPSFEMLTTLYFYPSEGHNGYLDVINDLGTVGILCLLGYFFTYIKQALQLMKTDRPQASVYLTFMFCAFLQNMSESYWFNCLGVHFVFMTLATTSLARSVLDAQLKSGIALAAAKATGVSNVNRGHLAHHP